MKFFNVSFAKSQRSVYTGISRLFQRQRFVSLPKTLYPVNRRRSYHLSRKQIWSFNIPCITVSYLPSTFTCKAILHFLRNLSRSISCSLVKICYKIHCSLRIDEDQFHLVLYATYEILIHDGKSCWFKHLVLNQVLM